MEKFGIFELLDALSAVTEQAGPPAAEPPAQTPEPVPKEGAVALQGFLRRHEDIAKRAKKSQ